MFKNLFSVLLALSLMFIFIQCQNEAPSITDPANMPTFWTAEEMTDYYAKVYVWPEDPLDFQTQFYNHKHRSQLTPDELDILIGKEQGYKQARLNKAYIKPENNNRIAKVNSGGSSYYFFETYYDEDDEYAFDQANFLYGDLVEWDGTNDVWFLNSDEMTNTTTVTNCRSFLIAYCAGSSTFTSLLSNDTGTTNCATSDYEDGTYLLYKKAISDNNSFIDLNNSGGKGGGFELLVNGSYVYTDLNPSFEDWTSNIPDAWQIDPSGDYVPSGWDDNYFLTNWLTQSSTYSLAGTYSARLVLRQYSGELTSAYFDVPSGYEDAHGDWIGSVSLRASSDISSTHEIHLGVSLHNSSGGLIASNIEECANIPTGSWEEYYTNVASGSNDVYYVRFTLYQALGQSTRMIYIDRVRLKCPRGDISLPVEWYGPDFDAWESDDDIISCDWTTMSELNCLRFKLFWRDGNDEIQLASNDYVSGQGNYPGETNYTDEEFELTSSCASWFSAHGGVEVFIGDQDYSGYWTYHEEDAIFVYDE